MTFDWPWNARYHPARALLFVRGLYLLVAADVWFAMIQHGGRYGVGGFNVAHFGFIDALLPSVSPDLYVGLLLASGSISSLLALRPSPVALRVVLAALYTASWLISLHDSYQHHYLISWLLLFCAGYPIVPASTAARSDAELVSGWGLPMTAITCGIVYTFTGISKCESEWRSGHVLRSLTHSREPGALHPGKFDGLRDLALGFGVDDADFWRLLAWSTIALQCTIALGYYASVDRDQRPSRTRIVVVSAGLLGSFAFHAVAELFHVFEIGLFSYYMLWIAALTLGPLPLITSLARPFAWAAEVSEVALRTRVAREVESRGLSRPLLIVGLLVMLGLALMVPLPGAAWASVAGPVAVVLQVLTDRWRNEPNFAVRAAVRALATALIAWCALSFTRVPFDYYRRTAGELRRMGKLREALHYYREAQRFAPPGSSRRQTIRELEQEIERTSPVR